MTDDKQLLTRLNKAIHSNNISDISQKEISDVYHLAIKHLLLHDISLLVLSETNFDTLLKLSLDKVMEFTHAERGFIALVDSDQNLDFKVWQHLGQGEFTSPEFETSRTIIKKCLENEEIVCVPNALEESEFNAAESVMNLQLLSVLVCPIMVNEKIMGIIYVDNRNFAQIFDQHVSDLIHDFSKLLSIAFKNATDYELLKSINRTLQKDLQDTYGISNIITHSPNMLKILDMVRKVAESDLTVLIQGEHGTGKELVARALHFNSNLKDKPFITVDCGALPANLIESELFGYTKGAFTGAIKDKKGKFELADGGTIFLDEIGEMSLDIQVKLLRVLQHGTFTPVGAEAEKKCVVRILAATNRNLYEMLKQETFRMDLYYRLNEVHLKLPTLAQRKDDILPLVRYFIEKYNKTKKSVHISQSVKRALLSYHFPGNIRQLENMIKRALVLCSSSTLELEHLPEEIFVSHIFDDSSNATFQDKKQKVVEHFEENELRSLLLMTKGKLRESAKLAGMDPKNFSVKLKKYDIKLSEF